MNKYIIRRTSIYSDSKPCEGAIKEKAMYLDYRNISTIEEAKTKFWFNEWFDGSINHREENGMIVSEKEDSVWTIEANNIDELFNRFGSIVVERSNYKEYPIQVEIYDDYRE